MLRNKQLHTFENQKASIFQFKEEFFKENLFAAQKAKKNLKLDAKVLLIGVHCEF